MAEGSQNSVSFERSLEREKARQKRRSEGGQHTQLSDRLQQHLFDRYYDQVQVVLPPAKKMHSDELSQSFQNMVQELLNGSKCCPFHQKELLCRTTDEEWKYYRCPINWRVFWCDADMVDNWLQRLPSSLHESYKEKPDENDHISLPFVCFCTDQDFHHLRMYKSRSKKNPHRFFLTCQFEKKYKFFQWLDQSLTKNNAKAWQWHLLFFNL